MEPQSDIFGTLCNPCMYNHAIFRTLACLEPKTSSKACQTCQMIRHIKSPEYSGIFNNDSYNKINFLFFTLILHTFQQNLKRHMFFDYNDINFIDQLS